MAKSPTSAATAQTPDLSDDGITESEIRDWISQAAALKMVSAYQLLLDSLVECEETPGYAAQSGAAVAKVEHALRKTIAILTDIDQTLHDA